MYLELQPENPVALAGIQRIAAYYQNAAEQSLRRDNRMKAWLTSAVGCAPPNDQARCSTCAAKLNWPNSENKEEQKNKPCWKKHAANNRPNNSSGRTQRREMETQQPWWQQPPNYQNNSGFNQR